MWNINARKIKDLTDEVAQLESLLLDLKSRPEPIIEESEVEERKVVHKEPINKGEDLCNQGDAAFYDAIDPNHYERAFKLYNLAAQERCGRACACLARMYEAGIYVDQDFVEAFKWYEKGADMRDSTCFFALGKYYEKDIVPDYVEIRGKNVAIENYMKAKDTGNHDAITKLAHMHEIGDYVDKNLDVALKLYTEAAEMGNPLAKNYLGLMEYKKRHYKAAVDLFRKASELGCARASNNLGVCYEEGLGVEKDPDKALECYQDAADKKYSTGMFNLGYLYLRKAQSTNQADQYFKASYWFRTALAEEPKMTDAFFYLGMLHEKGLGVDKDFHTSYSYYRKAANLGHAKACKRCGDLLYSGCGLLRADRREAFDCYVKASSLGDEEAYNALGLMHENGFEGMPSDQKKAFKCYSKSYERGCIDAAINLGLMYINGNYVPRDENKGNEYIIEAAERGSTKARQYLVANGVVPTIQHVKRLKYLKEVLKERRRDIPLLLGDEEAEFEFGVRKYPEKYQTARKCSDSSCESPSGIIPSTIEKRFSDVKEEKKELKTPEESFEGEEIRINVNEPKKDNEGEGDDNEGKEDSIEAEDKPEQSSKAYKNNLDSKVSSVEPKASSIIESKDIAKEDDIDDIAELEKEEKKDPQDENQDDFDDEEM